ncbi:glycoside hydrolase family 16 protein [Orenia marismortui]|uniref:glycoside hydrolase family 16 protein n=1 Tax=Orenia marismortui TaxID=46469 RepID=UPI000377429A|nr:glycoside hydrolase family 16 protein [Orenia marismortui]
MLKIKGKSFFILLLIWIIMILSGCTEETSGGGGNIDQQYTLTINIEHSLDSTFQVEVYKEGEMITSDEGDLVQFRLSNGNYTIKIYNKSHTKIRDILINGSNERIDISFSQISIPPDNWKPGAGWVLDWRDEFDSPTLDSSNWTRQVLPVETTYKFNKEWQAYTDSSENSYIQMQEDNSDGVLVIEAKYNGNGLDRGNFTSARVITNEKVEYKYGKIAARIKVPKGQGIWPAFWMLGTNISETGGTVDWPYCGEIDIMEKIGGNNSKEQTVHGTVHFANQLNEWQYIGGSKALSEYLSNDYHVYEVEWSSDLIIWKLDGVEYHRQDMSDPMFDEFEAPFYILLNVAVGGEWPGYPDSTTNFPQKMYIDWVRVYQ